jgi:hypothetical protein
MPTYYTDRDALPCQVCQTGVIRSLSEIKRTDTGRRTLKGRCQECLSDHWYWGIVGRDGKPLLRLINYKPRSQKVKSREAGHHH